MNAEISTAIQSHLPFAATIQERFEDFNARHPEVYLYLEQQCLTLHSAGWRHFGIRCIWERMRWHFRVEQDIRDDFKLNDHYTSRYARKLIAHHPELKDLFELREIRAD